MREGKIKSNIKSPPLTCEKCGYSSSGEEFKFGILWWRSQHCPKCKSKELKNYKLLATPPPSPTPKKLRF